MTRLFLLILPCFTCAQYDRYGNEKIQVDLSAGPVPRYEGQMMYASNRPIQLTESVLIQSLNASFKYAESLDVNPIHLRQKSMKGIKHFVEALNLYYVPCNKERYYNEELCQRGTRNMKELFEMSNDPGYHAIQPSNQARFNEESLSYLSALLLAERIGWNTTFYRTKLQALRSAYMFTIPARGAHQKLTFCLHCQQLGLPNWISGVGAASMDVLKKEAMAETYIKQRYIPELYVRNIMAMYHLTHEIFALSDYGSAEGPVFDDPEDQEYAKQLVLYLLGYLRGHRLTVNEIDITTDIYCELVMDAAYLGLYITPDWVELILRSQSVGGYFGERPQRAIVARFKGNDRYDVDVGTVLHTTSVCGRALVDAYAATYGPGLLDGGGASSSSSSGGSGGDLRRPGLGLPSSKGEVFGMKSKNNKRGKKNKGARKLGKEGKEEKEENKEQQKEEQGEVEVPGLPMIFVSSADGKEGGGEVTAADPSELTMKAHSKNRGSANGNNGERGSSSGEKIRELL